MADALVQARDLLPDGDGLRSEVDRALIREYVWAGRWDEAMQVSDSALSA